MKRAIKYTGAQFSARRMVKKYGLSAGSLSTVINGSSSSHKGWVCLGKKGDRLKDISTIKVTTIGERYNFLNLDTGEKFTGTQGEMWKKYKLIQSDVSAICRGKFKTTKNWVCLGLVGEKPRDVSNIKRSTKGDVHNFKNLKTGRIVSATISEMSKHFNLYHSNLSHLKSGRIKTYKDWVYLGKK